MATPTGKCVSISYVDGCLRILDQRLLPETTKFVPISSVKDAWEAIKTMQVRGAPAIAIVGALSVAVELKQKATENKNEIHSFVTTCLDFLLTSRPTAVNLRNAAAKLEELSSQLKANSLISGVEHKCRIIKAAEEMLHEDIRTNEAIGAHGATAILNAVASQTEKVNILTVCNTGSLATAGYGTALGVIRTLHKLSKLERVYCTETRPYNQGERLTAYELV